MADRNLRRKHVGIAQQLMEMRVRIRRYTLDPLMQQREELRTRADEAWDEWLKVYDEYHALAENPSPADLLAVEKRLLQVGRRTDLIQRELVSDDSLTAGWKTIGGIATALVVLTLVYLWSHQVRSLDFSAFEPLPEWGPVKYIEVAFWSSFGVLCWLLFLAAGYTHRRDFDRWFQPWYIATALRAPFLSVFLMIAVLEFVEWYGEGGLIETFLLEEGNKFFFIAFVSFALGLMTDETSSIARELADGVLKCVRGAAARIARRLVSTVSPVDTTRK